MNRNAILNAMEKVAKEIFEDNIDYKRTGQRGMLIVEIRDSNNPDQWHSSSRSFGTVFRDYQYEDELVVSNGTNFDALAHGKVAFCRRTNLNSGTNYYQVLGYESFWKGGIISDDDNCICAFAGFSGLDDAEIAEAGIKCYESLKRTGKSLVTGGDPEYEEEDFTDDSDDGTDEDDTEDGSSSGDESESSDSGASGYNDTADEKPQKPAAAQKKTTRKRRTTTKKSQQ